MIVGNGDIASVLTDKPDWVFFASGVSNSQENRESEFRRERELLLEQDPSKHLVYFSSLSIFYSDSKYAHHKRKMEKLVKATFANHTIVRIGNITWGSNPHTIINYFKGQKARGERLVIQNTYRYVVDQEEFLYWVNMAPDFSCEMNITGRRLTIKQIVDEFVGGV